MTAKHPSPDDLRTIARNLRDEGHTSRAEVLDNAAVELEQMQSRIRELEAAVEALPAVRDALQKIVKECETACPQNVSTSNLLELAVYVSLWQARSALERLK